MNGAEPDLNPPHTRLRGIAAIWPNPTEVPSLIAVSLASGMPEALPGPEVSRQSEGFATSRAPPTQTRVEANNAIASEMNGDTWIGMSRRGRGMSGAGCNRRGTQDGLSGKTEQ